MSLQVWLPLNGDLHNLGLADIDISLASGNTFITTDSKIGHGSLTLTKRLLISSTAFYGKKQISWALWVKVNTAWSAQWLDGIYWVTSDGSATDANRQEFYNNCTKVGMWYKGGSISGENFTPGVWTHLAGTVDYENGHAAFYINGIQQGSTTNNVDTTRYITSVYIGDSGIDIQENDVRIYDHILSKKEIEEISKGLVLHYKLDDTYMLSAENVMPNYLEMVLGSANASTGTWRLAGTSNMTRERVLITDSPEGECYGFLNSGILTANDGSCYGIDNFPLVGNSVYTISMWARIIDGSEGYAGYNIYNSTDKGGSYTTIDKNYRVTPLPASGEWVKCWYTFTTNASNTRNIYIGITTGSTSVTTLMCCIHIEKVDNTVDAVIYDSSGYSRNGSLLSIPYISSDTAHYFASMGFDGIDDGILIENLELSNIINNLITYSFWIKPSGENGARSVYFGSYSGTSWSIEKTTGNVLRSYWNGSPDITCTGATITDNVWLHICIVKNGTSDLKVYINGEIKFTSTATLSEKTFPTTYRIGRDTRSGDGTPYHGNMSDFRIYATALTEDLILELYHTSASIDNDGNIYTRELVEI